MVETDDLQSAVEEEIGRGRGGGDSPGLRRRSRIYVDSSNPTSSAAGDKIRHALNELKDTGSPRERCATPGIPESVLTPFMVKRTNVAGARKDGRHRCGARMLGYLMLCC